MSQTSEVIRHVRLLPVAGYGHPARCSWAWKLGLNCELWGLTDIFVLEYGGICVRPPWRGDSNEDLHPAGCGGVARCPVTVEGGTTPPGGRAIRTLNL